MSAVQISNRNKTDRFINIKCQIAGNNKLQRSIVSVFRSVLNREFSAFLIPISRNNFRNPGRLVKDLFFIADEGWCRGPRDLPGVTYTIGGFILH